MAVSKKNIALGLIPVLGIGWYLFRPELLFINQSVNESLPTSASNEQKTILKKGTFTSYSHETTVDAQIIKIGKKITFAFPISTQVMDQTYTYIL
jgi:hypothetical protein